MGGGCQFPVMTLFAVIAAVLSMFARDASVAIATVRMPVASSDTKSVAERLAKDMREAPRHAPITAIAINFIAFTAVKVLA